MAPDSKLSFNVKELACVFSERLQVLDLSRNKLKGYASDAMSVPCAALRILRLAGNDKVMGDIMEDLGKAPLLEELDVSRTKLFGNIDELSATKKADAAKEAAATAPEPQSPKEGEGAAGAAGAAGGGSDASAAPTSDATATATATPTEAEAAAASEKEEEEEAVTPGCPLLRILNVAHTEITGDMKHLGGCKELEQVLCQFASITGDIKVVCTLLARLNCFYLIDCAFLLVLLPVALFLDYCIYSTPSVSLHGRRRNACCCSLFIIDMAVRKS